MTTENFEKYLALLKGFLKLGDEEMEEIATELRDHLDQRVHELTTGKKMSVNKAELIAIKEFGDAAGMASSFLNVFRLKRRRWMMRFATFAIAGCFVVTVFLMSMWPQNGQLGIGKANAQPQENNADQDPFGGSPGPAKARVEPVRKKAAVVSSVGITQERSHSETQGYEALELEIPSVEYVETPLQDVIQILSKESGIPIFVNKSFLEENGFSMDEPITFKLNSPKLSTVLDLIFSDQLGLGEGTWAYGVKDGFIYVCGQENLRKIMEVRVYKCTDFAVKATVHVPIAPTGGLGGGNGGFGMEGSGGGFFRIPPQFSSNLQVNSQPQLGDSPTTQPITGTGTPAPVAGKLKSKTASSPQSQSGGMGGGGFTGGMGGAAAGVTPNSAGWKTYEIDDLSELTDSIKTTIDSQSWEELGGAATLTQVGSSLVIKQTLRNHLQIEELLVMLRKVKQLK